MAITMQHVVNFCEIFREENLSEGGHFKKEHLKRLCQPDRKVCMTALKQIEQAQLKDWDSSSKIDSMKLLDPKRLTEITTTILEVPEKTKSKKAPWYKAPFIWVVKAVYSLWLWIKNTFFGRISTKKMLDKVASYCHYANDAPTDINEIGKLILNVDCRMEPKNIRRLEILQGQLRNGLLKIYKILLDIKSEQKLESVMSKAISYSHVDGIDDPVSKPFHKIVHDCLAPFFNEDFQKSFQLKPYMKLNDDAFKLDTVKTALEDPGGKLFSAENEYKDALQKAKEDKKAEAEVEKLNKKVLKCKENLAILKKDFDEKSQMLLRSHMTIADSVRPLLLADISKMVTEILSELFNAASCAIKHNQSVEEAHNSVEEAHNKVKVDNTVETREVYKKRKVLLSEQIDKVNKKFDSTFNLIKKNVDIQMKELHKLKYGNVEEIGDTGTKLQLSKLELYGLEFLMKYSVKLKNDVKLLKLKYKIAE